LAASAIIGVWSTRPRIGKTTLAVDLAWRAAATHATLIWDQDPAGGCTWLGTGGPRRAGETDPQPTRWPGLALLPATPAPPQGPLARWRTPRPTPDQTIDHLRETYARIILDCPVLPGATLAAADLLIVPLPPVPDVAEQLDAARHAILRATGRHPPILPVLSMVDIRQRVHREVHEGPAAGWPMIPLASMVHQATAQHTPVGAHAGWIEASQRLQAIANAIESRLGG
jgi:chromosome partitioning protein